jgi:hypothetical protein
MKLTIAAALLAATTLVSPAHAALLLFEGQGAAGNTTAPRFSFLLDTVNTPAPFVTDSTRRFFPINVTFTLSNGTQRTISTGVNFTFQTRPNGQSTSEQGILNITNLGNLSTNGLGFSSFAVYNEFFLGGNSSAPVFQTGTFNVSTNPNNSPDNFIVTVSNAVPEPATWAMMIAGFGLVGGAMRRRKVAVSFA